MSVLDPGTGFGPAAPIEGEVTVLPGVTFGTTYPNDVMASPTYRNAVAVFIETINGDPYDYGMRVYGRRRFADNQKLSDGKIVNMNDGPHGRELIIDALDRTIRYGEELHD